MNVTALIKKSNELKFNNDEKKTLVRKNENIFCF